MAGARILSRAISGPFVVQQPHLTRPPPSVGRFVARLSIGRVPVFRSPLQSSGASFFEGVSLRPKLQPLQTLILDGQGTMSDTMPSVEGARAMGGGKRTFPGGVSKWQWRYAQKKKEKEAEKARLAREKQLFDERRRNEAMGVAPVLEKPWEPRSSSPASPLPPARQDPQVRALASRFVKPGAVELWTEEDGAVTRTEPKPSARFLPKAGGQGNFVGGSFGGSSSSNGKRNGSSKRRSGPVPVIVDTDMPLADDVVQRKKLKESPESSDEEPLVIEEKTASHLSKTRFDNFKISPLSLKALHEVAGFDTMTVVQNETLPVILKGTDVLARAKTGTGKTVAFLLPAIESILREGSRKVKRNSINVLAICPTRELATQVAAEAKMLTTFHRDLGVQVVIGGTNMATESARLQRSPCQILVGTPGRLLDHIQSDRAVRSQLEDLKVLILDEADQLLDMGFRKSLNGIIKALPTERQTLLFSATVPNEVKSMCEIALKKGYTYIDTVGEDNVETHMKVQQEYLLVPLEKQLSILYALLKEHAVEDPDFKVLVFCTSAKCTALFAEFYKKLGMNTLEIHSRKSQSFRTKASNEFRNHPGGVIMFTSDVSARGVDYPDVTFVVQVGTPASREQYIHRLGRTGRAGKEGRGLLLLTPWEEVFLRSLNDITITQSKGTEVSPDIEAKVNKALGYIDEDTKSKAYQAWLGYYNSCRLLKWDKQTLVKRANLFSSTLGLRQPPALLKKTVGMMGLRNVPGLTVI
ncbi:DEAD-box ATP-dependent RNA helicase 26 [Physcomitrium patens]|uniref:ATP-dependent RNA helicase n=1 Tax=Physcomitrium patens TaxID=3218 RepID=A0A2K1IRH4_PHYPA|nr:DEAD-box ATP-dependent RNA helicase 26-like [Physcomitrium patens]XP_024359525.1 DEAD-box ATP-dependent RNA helicase 26-like [Physcomitrium patens]XP_024359526.1 DEAD-box ATP-dependent RNA helicase 26-like [Physcomitrium patens]XP_024359527.1 DEAD-box ATP-dependent RNA helicase 26-like [Physcomitrium patens]PNR31882.1 hypothetical protein PHYPA_026005 [Physcomitrium patens]|eukprot:XP_024359524.1 DEAD-box ATP-dependent RNA helicase 26-like [Physcomitrella patens]